MQVYLVNLDRSTERLARMKALFEANGLEFTRISAVDGRLLGGQTERFSSAEKGRSYELGPGEIGCFLSHRKLWQAVTTGSAPHAAVFEDDVHFGEAIRDVLATDDWVPADADIVKLETTKVKTLVDKSGRQYISKRSVRRLRGTHTGTGGYIISKRGAAKLLEMSETFSDPVDQFMFNVHSFAWKRLIVYQLSPALCIQDMFLSEVVVPELRSTLANERPAKERTPFGQKLLREASRPMIRIGLWLNSTMHGYEWGRVPFR